MKIRVFNTMEMKNVTEYETKEILGIDEFDEDEKEIIKEGGKPMLNFVTNDGRNMSVPIELLISIGDITFGTLLCFELAEGMRNHLIFLTATIAIYIILDIVEKVKTNNTKEKDA